MSFHQFIRCTAHILALTAVLLGGLALAPTPVQAATFTVTNGNDSGSGSLREAIADANANPNADTITFDGVRAVTLTSGKLEISDDLTIDGGDGVIIERADTAGDFGIFAMIGSDTDATLDSLTIRNALNAGSGGGIQNDGGMLTVMNSTVSGNEADVGGGIWNSSNSILTIMNSTITGNIASNEGGGILSFGDVTITNSILSSNTAGTDGGGIATTGASSSLEVTDSILSGNTAVADGGGLFDNATGPTLTNVRVIGNTADDGGGLHHVSAEPALTNVLITGNRANAISSGDDGGGGIYNNSSNPTLVNVTIAGNYSDDDGGGIFNIGSAPSITNSIIWGNTCNNDGCEVFDALASAPTYDFSLVENETLGGTNLDGTNPANDPQFVNPVEPTNIGDNTPNTDGDYHLQQGSPLIDKSIEFSVLGPVTTDLDDTPRFVGSPGTVDLGPYELQCPTTTPARAYVDAAASGANTGLDWTNAMPNLQSALALTDRCSTPRISEVWVAQGSYAPDSGGTAVPNDRRATFMLRDNLQVYGGFAGDEARRSQRDPSSHLTILSGDIDGNDSQQPIVTDPNASSITGIRSNSYHVVTADGATSKTILDGFTITAGYAENHSNSDERGAGMLITNNAAPRLENLTLQGNVAEFGAGIHSHASQPTLINVTIANNTAGSTGGGMDIVDSSTPELTNVAIIGNAAKGGGGLFIRDSTPSLINVEITGNLARDVGGGMDVLNSNPSLTNATLAGNRAGNEGGGVYTQNDSDPDFINSIIWGNAAGANGNQVFNNDAASQPTYSFSLVQGASLGGDNLSGDTDPAFVTPVTPTAGNTPNADGNYRLQGSSGVIDQGDNNAVPSGVTTDVAGNQRILDGDEDGTATVDPGAYEYISGALYLPFVKN
jgi:hypothetical protein